MSQVVQNVEETQKLAKDFAARVLAQPPRNHAVIIGLEGELGAGKTTFVQALAESLGIKEPITSPTFVILKSYGISNGAYEFFTHIDAYRLRNAKELTALGFAALMSNPRNIIFLEWPDRVVELLPEDRITIHIDHLDANQRIITITGLHD
jgi:tRNA threonylcarbamoyladenosine biosynthesis protein TsaE